MFSSICACVVRTHIILAFSVSELVGSMSSKVVIAVAAVVILVGAGIGAFALMNNGSKDGSDSSTLSIDSPGEYVSGTYDKVVIGKA